MNFFQRFFGVFGHTRKYSSDIATPLHAYPFIIKQFMKVKDQIANNNAQLESITQKVVNDNPKSYVNDQKTYGKLHDAYRSKSFVDISILETQRLHKLAVEDEYTKRQRLAELQMQFQEVAFCHPNDQQQKILDQREQLNIETAIAKETTDQGSTIRAGLDEERKILDKKKEIFEKRKDARIGEKDLADFENENADTFNEAQINDAASRDIAKDRKHAPQTSKEAKEAIEALWNSKNTSASDGSPDNTNALDDAENEEGKSPQPDSPTQN